jgi:hypothetical protein
MSRMVGLPDAKVTSENREARRVSSGDDYVDKLAENKLSETQRSFFA